MNFKKALYCIYDDSAKQVVSLYFVSQSAIEAIRQFKGFIFDGKYPALPKELSLVRMALVDLDGTLSTSIESTSRFVDEVDEEEVTFIRFHPEFICRGDGIDEAYISYSSLTDEDLGKLKVTKNITESEFDESIKNADF